MRNLDAELFKDKIEVSLDGRQLFYLFFGGSVIASLVFVLGVMVGRRLESRDHGAPTTASADPLAALDELGQERLAFPEALRGGARSDEDDEPLRAPTLAAPAIAPSAPAAAVKPAAAAPKPQPAAQPAAPAPTPPPIAAAKPPVAADKPQAAAPAPASPPTPPAADKAAVDPSGGKGHFTLQLSSFQDRAEADAFQARIRAAGYDAFIIEATVPDKGTWYRVRFGRYLTHRDALDAKLAFESKEKLIAYVTRL